MSKKHGKVCQKNRANLDKNGNIGQKTRQILIKKTPQLMSKNTANFEKKTRQILTKSHGKFLTKKTGQFLTKKTANLHQKRHRWTKKNTANLEKMALFTKK